MGFAWAVFMPCLIVLSGLIIRFAMAQISGQSLASARHREHRRQRRRLVVLRRRARIRNRQPHWKLESGHEDLFPARSAAALLGGGAVLRHLDRLADAVVILPFLGVRLHPSFVWIPFLFFSSCSSPQECRSFSAARTCSSGTSSTSCRSCSCSGSSSPRSSSSPPCSGPRGALLATINPLTGILEGLRLAVVDGSDLLHPITGMVKGVERLVWSPWELALLRRVSRYRSCSARR